MDDSGVQPSILLRFDRGTLDLTGLDPETPPGGDGWVWDDRTASWRCAAIHAPEVRPLLRERWGRRLVDGLAGPAGGTPAIRFDRCSLPRLREEQRAALAAWIRAGRRGVVVMPTGTGKTELALAAMYAPTARTLVVAPIRALMYQWHHRILAAFGYDAGLVGDGLYCVRPITVTTYDSAYRYMPEFGDQFDLLVFDEVHHLPSRTRREAAVLSAAPHRLGLSATPERSDGKERDLGRLVGAVVYRLPMSKVRGTTLADYRIQRILVGLVDEERSRYRTAGAVIRAVLGEKRREDHEYAWRDLCRDARTDGDARRALQAFHLRRSIEDCASMKLDVVEDLVRLHSDERILVFAGSNPMAIGLSERLLVPSILAHSKKDERREILDGFAADRFRVVVANRVLDEGIDIPEAKIGIVLGGTAAIRQATQRLGRLLRRSGVRHAILYEVMCEATGEIRRVRRRHRCDAYDGTVDRSVWRWPHHARSPPAMLGRAV